MTRAVLALFLSTLALGLGLWTCWITASNHACARELSNLQRHWEMLEAANQQAAAIVEAHVWGQPNDPELAQDVRARLELEVER